MSGSKQLRHDMQDLATRLMELAESLHRRDGRHGDPYATEQFARLVPYGTTIKVGYPMRGGYDAYIVLPPGESKPTGWWMYNESASEPYYWSFVHGETEDEAIRKAIIYLLSNHLTNGPKGDTVTA